MISVVRKHAPCKVLHRVQDVSLTREHTVIRVIDAFGKPILLR